MKGDRGQRGERTSATGGVTLLAQDKGAPLVKIRGVNYSFGHGESKKQVLFDNNLDIFPGEVVIMTGPSGSGKTTLLTLIGALRSLQDGSLEVMGRQLMGLKPSQQILIRRSIGFIFQHHNLFEALTALQSVKLATEVAGLPSREADRQAGDILRELGLGDKLHNKPHKLSGGQQQRVAIGRALVNRPRLILADEPTAALDKDTGREVVELFQHRAKDDGCSVLIVSHDNRILDVADRIISMVDGRVISNVQVHETLELANIIRGCPAFKDAGPSILAEIAGQMKMEEHQAGAMVIRQGDIGERFYVVAKGRLDVVTEKDGLVQELEPRDFFGEIALMEDVPRQASVKAVTDAVLLSLSKAQFLRVARETPSFEEQMRRTYFGR